MRKLAQHMRAAAAMPSKTPLKSWGDNEKYEYVSVCCCFRTFLMQEWCVCCLCCCFFVECRFLVTRMCADFMWCLPCWYRNPKDGLVRQAVTNSKRDDVKNLLEEGGDVDEAEPKTLCTPLMLAVRDGSKEIVQLLLDYDADVTRRDKDGKSNQIILTFSLHKHIGAWQRESPKFGRKRVFAHLLP